MTEDQGLAWTSVEELRRSVVEMFRQQGHSDVPDSDIDREVIEVLAQTLDNLYRALDYKNATIDRLTERLRELGQGAQSDDPCQALH